MNDAVKVMLARYDCRSVSDHENALVEIMQEIALLALWRGKFFEKAAFYGGTALRILYGLDRFSEDLDFTLLKSDPWFDFTPFLDGIRNELASFGFELEITQKVKTIETSIISAFMKMN